MSTLGGAGCVGGVDALGPLEVIASDPAPGGVHPADRPLRVGFDRWLRPGTIGGRVATLRSGDEENLFPIQIAYDPVGPALVVIPVGGLEPGLAYTLSVFADGVVGHDGTQLGEDLELSFFASPAGFSRAGGSGTGAGGRVDFEAELAPIFDARCGCHGPEPAAWPPLRPEVLIEGRSKRGRRYLVFPGRPLASLLLLKLLPDYPGVLGASMPPDDPLEPAQVRAVVSWIEQLRRP